MFNQIRGIVSFSAEGDNLELFLNELRINHIECFSIICTKGSMQGRIYKKNIHTASDVAEKKCVDFKLIKKSGAVFKIVRYKKRYGVFAGLAAVFALIFIMSNHIFYIDITGNEILETGNIITSLKNNGIYAGKFIPDIDFKAAEHSMMLQYPEIAWIGIHNTGGRIVVEIDEAVPTPKLLSENIPCNIVASRDAAIVKVEVWNGALVPLVGDAVRKGDLIVSGTLEDKHGETRFVHSCGKITGRFKEKVTFTQEFHTLENIPTGEETEQKSLYILDLRIPLFRKKVTDEKFDYREEFTAISLFTVKLPMGIIHHRYFPYDTVETFYSREQSAEKLKEQMQSYEKNYFSEFTIINTEIQENETPGNLTYSVLYTLEGEIGNTSEIVTEN